MTAVPLVLAIGCAGALGAVTRFTLVEWMARRWRGHFPVATFLINVTGSFALGLLLTLGTDRIAALTSLRAALGTGFLGGYTTFSTLSFETHALARRDRRTHAWLNALATLLAGVFAAALGVAVGGLL